MKSFFSTRSLFLLSASTAIACTFSPIAFAQTITSTAATVGLTATVAQSLTVTATPATLTFALVPSGVAAASGPVSIVTTWVLGAANTTIEVDGSFASPTAALTSADATPALIPSSDVLGQVATGTPTTFAPFTGTGVVGTAGAGLALFTVAITDANRSGTRTDALNLEVDLTASPQVPASTYTGTLTIQANSI